MAPPDDLLSELIIAKEDGDRLDRSELISMPLLLLAAGHETTVTVHLATARDTTRPFVLGGREIGAREFIMISLAAANRDPDRFTHPDRIDVDRADNRHIAFGHGIHFCLGAALARMAATIAINRLLDRIPELSLDPEYGEPIWRRSLLIRGLTALPVSMVPANEPELEFSAV
ncbi:cytochrome P450 [Nocardia elegans]|uniref:Cytochrome P450 n=1 Tax=Nocardia elegans TaxID=300029 RepID=A0ABW6TJY8_9NOCA|nr:cytochrome P450 [Nocardia elegans]MBF6450985.1 cytochrome P450 [Nocardia elegans]